MGAWIQWLLGGLVDALGALISLWYTTMRDFILTRVVEMLAAANLLPEGVGLADVLYYLEIANYWLPVDVALSMLSAKLAFDQALFVLRFVVKVVRG